jgi:hypothetical protein
MRIRIIILSVVMVGVACATRASAQQGPVLGTNADVTCPQATGTGTPGVAMAASTPVPKGTNVTNRMCAECDWVSGSPARLVEGTSVTADLVIAGRGIPIAAATSAAKTLCIDGAIYCFGVGGTSVLACNQVNRQ